MSDHPIPVICDRCRAQGHAGEAAFTDLAGLLDFEPVPRRPRADGWTAELQRAFIAALAVAGSPRRAATIVGKAVIGAERMRAAKGGEGFSAAWDKAIALAEEKGRQKLNTGLGAALGAAVQFPGTPPDPARLEADELRARQQCLDQILRKFVVKLADERQARLAGKIIDADFYLRQLTHLEVMADLMGTDGFHAFTAFRDRHPHLNRIAETPLSRLMDDTRRAFWARCDADEPFRPRELVHDLLVDLGVIKLAPTEVLENRSGRSHAEQEQAYRERHAADAAKQIEWEAEARRDYERRRAAAPHIDEEPGPAGRPAS